jgi:hypothetical protein
MPSQPPTSAPAQVERRFHQRRKIRESLEIDWGSSVLQGTVTDIGPKGLFVELTPQLWVGAPDANSASGAGLCGAPSRAREGNGRDL